MSPVRRFSSRLEPLSQSFLLDRLRGAKSYDRIAGYFSSSLIEVAGEELESITGPIRLICNSDLNPADVITAKAAQAALRRSWCASQPESYLDLEGGEKARSRFQALFEYLRSGKLQVRVLPDNAFGLVHGKAGVVTLADGSKTSFLGSANESKSAWEMNYELVWEDSSSEAVEWVQEEFNALWSSPYSIPLADFVVEDLGRLSKRKVIPTREGWKGEETQEGQMDPAPVVIESPVYRREVGLWEHQKYFVKTAFDAHKGPLGKARYILADQVGLGKTLQLAMTALLIGLSGDKPILIICPKTLIWQWQGEMLDLLGMPSAVWIGKQWVDEREIEYPVTGSEGIRRCPRRVGIVSGGLVTRRSDAVKHLLSLTYDCVILDEAHRARRKNLGDGRDNEAPDANNLLAFMKQIADRTQSLLLATATPVQIRPIEAWDLLDILSHGDESVLGNSFSRWRKSGQALSLVMGSDQPPESIEEQWEWIRNPLPPKEEHRDFEILRAKLALEDKKSVVDGDAIMGFKAPEVSRLRDLFPRYIKDHNPFITRIIRRTREQLENQIDPETNEPLLQKIGVELFGEGDREAILLPPYLHEAYDLAEEFCRTLGQRMKGAGFLKTLLLRRVGSTVYAGLKTAQKMLSEWEDLDPVMEEEEDLFGEEEPVEMASISRSLTSTERDLLEKFVAALEANQERDPKYQVVLECLAARRWLERGCIIFSQYRDSVLWLAEQLTEEYPEEQIAVYSGSQSSGIYLRGAWTRKNREDIKTMVRKGELKLMIGTDAASEGLNLQRLATLINLDLPWNPTRLEQRKGRIQRIGQVHDKVYVYNMRYKDSVEDRVHQLLSDRLKDIYNLFGQLPDVLEDAWVAMAMGEREQAAKIIDEVPKSHPFELRYANVERIDWESCEKVLDPRVIASIMRSNWS
ncbi:MAG: helicase-related protein [bacterium]|nr:helicase-related protein [bacterium]